MAGQGDVLVSHVDAPWLPPGGRAEVVLAARGAAVPSPTCLVRLLVTRDDLTLAVARPDGSGLDIPATRPAPQGPEVSVRRLCEQALGSTPSVTLLGYVRNVVVDPPSVYPWPSPNAYFAVWHCAVGDAARTPEGVWLDRAEAKAELGGRHWWPLAAHRAALASSRRNYAAIREWAKTQGIEVSERGRVASSVIEQYDAAQ